MSNGEETSGDRKARSWSGFNNVGLCAVAIASILNLTKFLSLPKAMLVLPLVIHEPTLKFLAKGNVRERQVGAFVSMNPEFIANFDKRYQEALVVSLNAVQLLIALGYIQFDGKLKLIKELSIDESFGKQARLIERSAKNMSALLSSSDDELYLNLRVSL